MTKDIEKAKNKEVHGNKGTKEELNELKEEIIFHENENSDDGGHEHLDPLDEKLKNIIPISEIGQFDNEGHFNLREDIKGEDEIGSYILVRGQKYYDDITRSKIEEFEGQGYHISKYTDGSESVELGKMNNIFLESGTKYFNDRILSGKRDLDGHMKGIVKLSDSDGSIRIFDGEFENGLPKNCTLKKFENGKLKYTYKGTFNPTRQSNGDGIVYSYRSPDGEGTMRWPDENNFTQMYTGEWKNGKYNGKGHSENNGFIYEGEWKNGKKDGKCEHYTIPRFGTYHDIEWKEGKAIECQGTIIYENGASYSGDLLVNEKGKHEPFFKILGEAREKSRESGEFDKLPKNMHGVFMNEEGKKHEFTVTNGSISEKGNGFITMYGDKLPDTHRDNERGDVMYHINFSSDPTIKYDLTTWENEITWSYEGNSYKFTNKQGKFLSLPSSIGEKGAMHAANLINCLKYLNKSIKFRFDDKNIYSTSYRTRGYTSGGGITYHETTTECDGTTLLKDVQKHFGGISAGHLATRLNGDR